MTSTLVFSLAHWEVYNEQEQRKPYEARTGDADVMQLMFHEVAAHAPQMTLMLNDVNVVTGNGGTAQVNTSCAHKACICMGFPSFRWANPRLL